MRGVGRRRGGSRSGGVADSPAGPGARERSSTPGARFSVAADTQVVMLDPGSGAFAYVHHFTLYDARARGFVRPYCLSYVSLHADKLMRFHAGLRDDFTRVAELLRHANLVHFFNDLACARADLVYTHGIPRSPFPVLCMLY